jgi:hypothetical protein
MNSRPFEGALLSLLLGAWLLFSAWRGKTIKSLLVWSAPGALLVLLPVLAWMGYYNYRITGHALRMPYAEHAAQYMRSPIFFWQQPNPERRSGVPHLDAFFDAFERPEWESQTTPTGFLRNVFRKLVFLTADTFRPVVLLPVVLIGGWLAVRRRAAARIAGSVCVGLLIVHFALTPWLRIQYLGVIAPLFVLFVTLSLRELDALWRGLPIGSVVALTLLVALPVTCVVFAKTITSDPSLIGRGREKCIRVIESQPGNHLVFVYYPDGPQAIYEWVYNSADIDAQRVIWAHAINLQGNTELIRHYADRSVWLLTAQNENYQLQPAQLRHPPATVPASP